ncbi:MAG TPA: hypothetical protein VFB39_05235 [Solirubrobacteraceae bacterium]|nr:hypothetical protein [Solirubrobacteraceae bacterium]
MTQSSVSVGLYLDQASDPISGSLVYPDGRRLAFAGWIELTAALEEARHFEPLDVVAHGERSGSDAVSEAADGDGEERAKPEDEPA